MSKDILHTPGWQVKEIKETLWICVDIKAGLRRNVVFYPRKGTLKVKTKRTYLKFYETCNTKMEEIRRLFPSVSFCTTCILIFLIIRVAQIYLPQNLSKFCLLPHLVGFYQPFFKLTHSHEYMFFPLEWKALITRFGHEHIC